MFSREITFKVLKTQNAVFLSYFIHYINYRLFVLFQALSVPGVIIFYADRGTCLNPSFDLGLELSL